MSKERLITDEARAWVGKELSTITFQVSKDDIKKLAIAIGDLNPLYLDEERARKSRYGGIIAHPLQYHMYPLNLVPESELTTDGITKERALPMKYSGAVFGGAEAEFFVPIRPGDIITAKKKIVDMTERESSKGGWIALITYEITSTNQKGEVVTVERMVSVLR